MGFAKCKDLLQFLLLEKEENEWAVTKTKNKKKELL
jgi:hypothetical protein